MRTVGTRTAALALVAILALICSDVAAPMDACSDCEAKARGACWSATACYHKMPGWICRMGNDVGRCVDVEHEACEDEPQEVCCGCDIYVKQSTGQNIDPPGAIPDGDPAGASWTIVVDESHAFDFIDIGIEMNHGQMGELQILLSHSGTTVALVLNPVCEVGLTCEKRLYLSDVGVGPIQSPPEDCAIFFPDTEILFEAPYEPAEPLAAFYGMDTAGEWTLTIADVVPGSRSVGEICFWEVGFVQWQASPVDDTFSWGTIKALYRN